MMPPGPKVAKLNGELVLLGEAEDDTVAVGREAFALLYQEVASLSAEVKPDFSVSLMYDDPHLDLHPSSPRDPDSAPNMSKQAEL